MMKDRASGENLDVGATERGTTTDVKVDQNNPHERAQEPDTTDHTTDHAKGAYHTSVSYRCHK